MKLHVTMLAALTAAALLGACDRQPGTPTAGERVDATVAQAEQKTEQARSSAAEAARDTKDAAVAATSAATDKVKDAAITASVKSKLAADPGLSALAIDVDTAGGRVALQGKAPDAAARERATSLASQVDGVVSVDNQLVVAAR